MHNLAGFLFDEKSNHSFQRRTRHAKVTPTERKDENGTAQVFLILTQLPMQIKPLKPKQGVNFIFLFL